MFSWHSYLTAETLLKLCRSEFWPKFTFLVWIIWLWNHWVELKTQIETCHHTSLTFSNNLLIHGAEMNLLTLHWKQILILFHIYLDFAQEGKNLTFLIMAAETSTEIAKTAKQVVLKEEVQHAWVWRFLLLNNNYL